MNRNDRRIALTAITMATLALIGLWLTDGEQQTTLVEQQTKDSTCKTATIIESNYRKGTRTFIIDDCWRSARASY